MAFAPLEKANANPRKGIGATEQQKANWLQEMALSFEVRDPRAMTIRFGNGASGTKWKSQLALGPTWHRFPRPASGPMSKASELRAGRAGGVYNPGDVPLARQTTQLQGCAHGAAQHEQRLEDITPAPATRAGRLSRAEQGMNMAKSEYEELARHAQNAGSVSLAKARAAKRTLARAKTSRDSRAMTEAQALVAVTRARQRADLRMVLRLMHRFALAERVQRAGCAAVLALSREEQMGRRPALMADMEHLALTCTEAVLLAIWSHPGAPHVAELACAALMELVPCHAATARAVAEVADITQRDMLREDASLTALRIALSRSRGSAMFATRRPGTAAGGGGSGRPATAPYAFVKRNGCCCDAICASMEAHPHHPGLQRRAAAALAVIAQASERAAEYLRSTGAHELLRHALATFPIDAAVCTNARRALKLLGMPAVQDLAEDELQIDDDFTLFETLARGGFPDASVHSPAWEERREQEQLQLQE